MRQQTLTSRRGAHRRSPLVGAAQHKPGAPTSLTVEWATRRWQQRVEAEARRQLKREIDGVSAPR